MEYLFNLLNIILVASIVGLIFYFIDRQIINKKYYSAYKKAYQYVLLTIKPEDRLKILKNLKEYQKEVLENAQFILTESQTFSKDELEKRKSSILLLIEKLNKDKSNLLTQLDKLHSEISNEDINKTYEKLKEDLSIEIAALKELIKEKEDEVNNSKKERDTKLASIKKVSFISTPINIFSNKIMSELQSLTNLLPFYALISVEYLISVEFFSQLFKDGELLGQIVPFLLTTMLLIFVDLSINFIKEKKENYGLGLGTFTLGIFFIITYSRIYPQIDGDMQILLMEILKVALFIGVIILNYFLMEKYKIKSEDLIFAPIRIIKVLVEIVTSFILNISTTGAKIASKTADIDRISFERSLNKKIVEIEKMKEELEKKNTQRSNLNTKKDEETNKRKRIVSVEIDKRIADLNNQITKLRSDLGLLEKSLTKNFEFNDQVRNGSFDGTYSAVKKFYKIK